MSPRVITLLVLFFGLVGMMLLPGGWQLVPGVLAFVAALVWRFWQPLSQAAFRLQAAWWRIQAQDVDVERLQSAIGFLRYVTGGFAAALLLVLPLLAWRSAEARAQALRLRYERMGAATITAMAVWDEAYRQVAQLATDTAANPRIPEQQRIQTCGDLAQYALTCASRRDGSRAILGRIVASRDSVPELVWPWTPVADPLTTITARASALPEALKPLVLSRLAAEAEKSGWQKLASAASAPGAPALPPPSAWEAQ